MKNFFAAGPQTPPMPFNQFLPYLGVALHANPDMAIDAAAWTEYTQHDFEQCIFDSDELLDLEAEVIASGSIFGRRLHQTERDNKPSSKFSAHPPLP